VMFRCSRCKTISTIRPWRTFRCEPPSRIVGRRRPMTIRYFDLFCGKHCVQSYLHNLLPMLLTPNRMSRSAHRGSKRFAFPIQPADLECFIYAARQEWGQTDWYCQAGTWSAATVSRVRKILAASSSLAPARWISADSTRPT
jgi:hypothetical protein